MKQLKNDEKMPDINSNVICPNCYSTEVVYNTLVADYRCQACGNWFMGEEIKKGFDNAEPNKKTVK